MLCIALGCFAKKKQDYPCADIKVNYNYREVMLKTDAKAYTEEFTMTLLATTKYSKFYNLQSEYIDSLRSTPSGYAKYRKMMDAGVRHYSKTGSLDGIPLPPIKLYVFKDSSDSCTRVYNTNGSTGSYHYSEPLGGMQWQIGDSTKNILGYECIKAETDFRGRRWTAWFTPEIPLQDGPWKLCGLPGLILEASETEGQHTFTANGIEKSNEEIRPVYNIKKYEKADRKEALSAQLKFLLNGDPMSRAFIQNTPDGSKIDFPDQFNENPDIHVDFLEKDYH